MLSLNGYTMGMMFSATFKNANTSSTLLPALILPFILFCGALANLETVAVWLRWL